MQISSMICTPHIHKENPMKTAFVLMMLLLTCSAFARYEEKVVWDGHYENIAYVQDDLREIEKLESNAAWYLTKKCHDRQVGNVRQEDIKLKNFRLIVTNLKMRRKFSKPYGFLCIAVDLPSMTPRYKYSIKYYATAKCVIE